MVTPPMIRAITPLIVPVITIAAAIWLLPRVGKMPPTQQEMVVLTPYLLTMAGLMLSVHFRRGRICMLLLMTALGYYLTNSYLLNAAAVALDRDLIYKALAVLLPFNLMIVVLMREKGVYGSAGRMRIAFLGLQLLVLYLTMRHGNAALWESLTKPIVSWPVLLKLKVPQISLLLLGCATLLSFIRGITRHSPIEACLFGVGVAYLTLLNWHHVAYLPAVFCSAATLIMVLAVVQESHNMAFRDDLTGLPSRRALNEQLPGLGSRYAIAMVDVDHFKRFNDTYGHDVGDQVLKMVAGRMMSVSGGGRPFRYGGEEFTVLFSGKTAKDAYPHLERLRQDIADYVMSLRGDDRPKDNTAGESKRRAKRSAGEVSVTVSIGVAEVNANRSTPAEVIKAADQALYKAKHGGRNQVCMSGGR